ncbi:MAG: aminoglycoside phosphotransferase family protein [Spirochaetales bacterium]|nr:aminoglycoside phosphotransferase family protein [Spirochaetales bacterium]
MEKIGEGETSEVFRIDGNKVIKLFKPEFFNQDSFDLEYAVAKYMGENSDLAPRVHGKVILENRSGYVMDEVKGELFQNVIDSDPANLRLYATLFGENHSRLHVAADVRELPCLDRMKDVFPDFLNSNGNFPQEVDAWLKETVFSLSDELVLGHADYMPYNLIITGNKLLAIDWAESGLGPAEAGIARTLNFIADPTDYPDSEYTRNSELFIKWYLEAYTAHVPINMEELEKCLLLNAACEYNWAVCSGQVDEFSLRQKEYVQANYKKPGSKRLIVF